jgi:hypothetical protein
MIMKGDPCIAKAQMDCKGQPDCNNSHNNVQPGLPLP